MPIYLDNANSTYPKPKEAIGAITDTASKHDVIPGDGYLPQMQRMVSKTVPNLKKAAAELFDVADDEIFVSTSASKAIFNILTTFLESGDRLVIGEADPAPILSASRQIERHGITVARVPYDKAKGISMTNLKKSISGARMLVLSHSNNVTGAILPVDEIAKLARDAHCMFMLDVSHTAGRMPINLRRLGVACAVASGHKFLYGPTGTGIAYIGGDALKAQAKHRASAKPCFEHVEDHTPNILGYSGLQASLRFIIKENIDRIRQHDKLMREAMLGSLEMIKKVKILAPDAEEGVATVSFTCKDYPPNVISRLLEERFGIQIGNGLCSNQGIHETLSTYPDGCCRISAGFFNSQSDVEFFATSLTSIVHSK